MMVFVLLAVVKSAAASKYYAKPPHIVFILADDLGRADMSTYGSPQIPTPNLDALASSGVLLNNYYVQPMCTPSRASLMTGLYAIHTGLHHLTLMPGEPSGLPLNLKIIPEHLRDLGYETHCVGKWGIGYASLDYTPTYRGFDSFYGMYSGPIDYYSHDIQWKGHRGFDLWQNTQPLKNETGRYLTTLFEERAEYIIANRNKSKPLFLFLAHQAPHKTFGSRPMQAPQENVEKFSHIGEEKRMLHAGMVDTLDQSIGSLMEALEAASMLEDTVLVFSSDNGATHFSLGGNWPLRGIKSSLWEGAIRAAGFIWSPRLERSRRVSEQLMHISDWLPTLYSSAGGNPQNLGLLDGLDMWRALSTGERSPRVEILHNIDHTDKTAALRYLDFKLVVGSSGKELDTRHEIRGQIRPYQDLDLLLRQSKAAAVLRRFYAKNAHPSFNDASWRRNATTSCGKSIQENFAFEEAYYLFDVGRDPCELNNMAQQRPVVLYLMLAKLVTYNATVVPAVNKPVDPKAFPENNSGVWAPWIDGHPTGVRQ